MTNTDYDLIVLGGGMAGLPVAMKCGYSGMDVALVEEGLLGGTCLNRGCIPTAKTMLRSAEVANLARRSEEFGIDIDGAIEPDIDAIVERKDDIVESIRKGPTRTSRATRTSTSSKVTASSNPHMKFASTIEPSRPKPSSSTRAPDRRGRRSTASTTSTFTTARICWSVPRFPLTGRHRRWLRRL